MGVIWHPMANICYGEYAYQIWSLHVIPFHRYIDLSGSQNLLIYSQNLHYAWAVSPIFGYPIPIFPMQYATFTEISLTIRGVSCSLSCKAIALFGPLKMVFWGKRGKIWPAGKKTTPKEHTHHGNTFWVHWTKFHASQGKLWTRWRNQKIQKNTRRYNFTPMPTPPPICGGHCILRERSDCKYNQQEA